MLLPHATPKGLRGALCRCMPAVHLHPALCMPPWRNSIDDQCRCILYHIYIGGTSHVHIHIQPGYIKPTAGFSKGAIQETSLCKMQGQGSLLKAVLINTTPGNNRHTGEPPSAHTPYTQRLYVPLPSTIVGSIELCGEAHFSSPLDT